MSEVSHSWWTGEDAVFTTPAAYLSLMKTKIAIAAAVVAGLGALTAGTVAWAHSPIGAYVERTGYHVNRSVERSDTHAEKIGHHTSNALDHLDLPFLHAGKITRSGVRTARETVGDPVETTRSTVEFAGYNINETGKWFNRTMNPPLG
jgi:hypothetical protein